MKAMRLSVSNMFHALAVALAAWSTGTGQMRAATAQTLILPTNAANSLVALGSGQLRAANYRIQEVYGAQNFAVPGALYITELRYRPDSTYGSSFNTVIGNIEIRLSTTTREADALSQNYSQNPGTDETLVYGGALSISKIGRAHV